MPQAAEGHSSWEAELSSLKGMAPSPVCQEETQVAPTLGRAVGGLGVLPVLAGVGTRDGSPWRRRQLHVHALAHTHTSVSSQTYLEVALYELSPQVCCPLLKMMGERRKVVELVNELPGF